MTDIKLFCLYQVAEGALRCFASLADRFTRRGVDPAPLAQHGLVTELLARLSNAAGPSAPSGACPGQYHQLNIHDLTFCQDVN